MGMSSKLTFAVGSIVAVLLVSGLISIFEFRRMSHYVSDRISENISCVNVSTELAVIVDEYNISILSVVGEADSLVVSGLDPKPYLTLADSLISELSAARLDHADSLRASFTRYTSTSLQLDSIVVSDFVDTRDWYFTVLQPQYNEFRKWHDKLNKGINEDLQDNSISFDDSFYRSITPTVVSVSVAIILSLLLLFFILEFYIRPLKKMLKAADSYKRYSNTYNVAFEGDDQLQELNSDLKEITEENASLKRRLRDREC